MTVKLLHPFLNMTIKSKATYNQTKDMAAANMRLAEKRVQRLNEAFPLRRDKSYLVSSSVTADCLMLRNPPLRQAPNRYRSL